MSLLDILKPKPVKPVNARLVTPRDNRQEPLTQEETRARRRETQRKWLADNRERLNAKRRKA